MRLFGKAAVVFLVFMLGTMAFIHVDRQCAYLTGKAAPAAGAVENIIEKQGGLL